MGQWVGDSSRFPIFISRCYWCVDPSGPIWTHVDQGGPMWTHVNPYGPESVFKEGYPQDLQTFSANHKCLKIFDN